MTPKSPSSIEELIGPYKTTRGGNGTSFLKAWTTEVIQVNSGPPSKVSPAALPKYPLTTQSHSTIPVSTRDRRNVLTISTSSLLHIPQPNKAKRRIARHIRRLKNYGVVISARMTAEAIKTTKKSKALGPDKLAPIHLHHLGPKGVSYLARSYNTSIIPHKWKVGKLFPS